MSVCDQSCVGDSNLRILLNHPLLAAFGVENGLSSCKGLGVDKN